MRKSYLLLRVLVVVFQIAGAFVLVLGVVAALLLSGTGRALGLNALATRVPVAQYWRQLGLPQVSTGVAAAITAVAGLVTCVFLYALGEVIALLLDIEQHCSETDRVLQPRV